MSLVTHLKMLKNKRKSKKLENFLKSKKMLRPKKETDSIKYIGNLFRLEKENNRIKNKYLMM